MSSFVAKHSEITGNTVIDLSQDLSQLLGDVMPLRSRGRNRSHAPMSAWDPDTFAGSTEMTLRSNAPTILNIFTLIIVAGIVTMVLSGIFLSI